MPDCARDVVSFHNDEVTLPTAEQTAMRRRRNANRDRLKGRLIEDSKPTPVRFIKQGSYAMLTMVQDPDNDYDIDDGVYFTEASLKDRSGNPMLPAAVREMVRFALRDDRFNKQPVVKTSCARVFYAEGYRVDMPVYRIRTHGGDYELASGSTWVVSRASDVEQWFNEVNSRLSPDQENGGQFRRIVRDLKKFARSRASWKEQVTPGFTVTKLVAECFVPNRLREDLALRDTMESVYRRLVMSLEVMHPVTPGARLTNGPNDSGAAFLRDRLREALQVLAVLGQANCTHGQALAAWDTVFNTTYFTNRQKSSLRPAATAAGGLAFPNQPVKPNKPAGFA